MLVVLFFSPLSAFTAWMAYSGLTDCLTSCVVCSSAFTCRNQAPASRAIVVSRGERVMRSPLEMISIESHERMNIFGLRMSPRHDRETARLRSRSFSLIRKCRDGRCSDFGAGASSNEALDFLSSEAFFSSEEGFCSRGCPWTWR